jgi:hypothetical protein
MPRQASRRGIVTFDDLVQQQHAGVPQQQTSAQQAPVQVQVVVASIASP